MWEGVEKPNDWYTIGIPWIFLYGSDDVTPNHPQSLYFLIPVEMYNGKMVVPSSPCLFQRGIFFLYKHSSSSCFLQNPVGIFPVVESPWSWSAHGSDPSGLEHMRTMTSKSNGSSVDTLWWTNIAMEHGHL